MIAVPTEMGEPQAMRDALAAARDLVYRDIEGLIEACATPMARAHALFASVDPTDRDAITDSIEVLRKIEAAIGRDAEALPDWLPAWIDDWPDEADDTAEAAIQ